MSNRARKSLEAIVPPADGSEAYRHVVRAEANYHADILLRRLTARLVRHHLAALDPDTVTTIARMFGRYLYDALTRARIFEECEFHIEGGDEDRMAEHKSI